LIFSWPHAIIFASITIWSRLDQIAASYLIDYSAAGIYGLAVRLVGMPQLASAAMIVVLFPELQRLGRDAPEKVNFYTNFVLKLLVRFGAVLCFTILWVLGVFIAPLVPKFQPAISLLIWFAPGIWAFWLYSITTNALLGLRFYRQTCVAYTIALIIYMIVILPLTKNFGLIGVVLSYDMFSIVLFAVSFYYFHRYVNKGELVLFSKFSLSEKKFLSDLRLKLS
jgi:O-antigen/teichoic acid export membrane protein